MTMNNTQWQIGESVVIRNTHQQGTVINSETNNQGISESVQIQYKDGSSEWVSINDVSKLLVEVEPKSDKKFLSE
tara:strand:+ start:3028 stop:3252 length:225 start_codon:yes stop_codon:yes gene_type:complete